MNTAEAQRHTLGAWIQERRKYLRLSQAVLAGKVGRTTDLISKIERGQRGVSPQLTPRLIQAFDLNEEERAGFARLVQEAHGEILMDHPPPLPVAVNIAPPAGLPTPNTALIGREAEIKKGVARLRETQTRLLSLTGPPGVGKTRIGIEIARQLLDDFKDGVRLVQLASLPPGMGIAQTLFQHMVAAQPGETGTPAQLLHILAQALTGRRFLLVLDNFEHVATAENLQTVSDLLAASKNLKILVTSRSALFIRAEVQHSVAPLALAGGQRVNTLENLTRLAMQPVVRLLIDRAEAVNPGFVFSLANAKSVYNLCLLTEGIPLVIELLAARLRLLSPKELLAQVSATDAPVEFLLELTGPRDVPERQHSLARAIAWSFGLLDAEEQQLLMKLAVFAGGFTLQAAIDVCDARWPVVEALIMHSLLQTQHAKLGDSLRDLADSDDPAARETRYYMLESIRAYANSRLIASGQLSTVRRRQAIHILDEVTVATTAMSNSAQADRRLHRDLDNVRAALRWTHAPEGDVDLAVRLTQQLAHWWWLHGYADERQHWLERSLNLLGFETPPKVDEARPPSGQPGAITLSPAHKRAMLYLAGHLYMNVGPAGLLAGVTAALTRLLADPAAANEAPARLMLLRALLRWRSEHAPGDPEIQRHEKQLFLLGKELSDPAQQARLWNAIGAAARNRGDDRKAHALITKARKIYEQLGDEQNWTYQVLNLAVIEHFTNDETLRNRERSVFDVRAALRVCLKFHNIFGIAMSLFALSTIAATQHQWERCVTLYYAAEQIRAQHHFVNGRLDLILITNGQTAARAALSHAAFDKARLAGDRLPLSEIVAIVLPGDTPQANH